VGQSPAGRDVYTEAEDLSAGKVKTQHTEMISTCSSEM
jgi:hypothetical protein